MPSCCYIGFHVLATGHDHACGSGARHLFFVSRRDKARQMVFMVTRAWICRCNQLKGWVVSTGITSFCKAKPRWVVLGGSRRGNAVLWAHRWGSYVVLQLQQIVHDNHDQGQHMKITLVVFFLSSEYVIIFAVWFFSSSFGFDRFSRCNYSTYQCIYI